MPTSPRANPWAVSLYVAQEHREVFAAAKRAAEARGISFAALVFLALAAWLKKEAKR